MALVLESGTELTCDTPSGVCRHAKLQPPESNNIRFLWSRQMVFENSDGNLVVMSQSTSDTKLTVVLAGRKRSGRVYGLGKPGR